MRQRPACVIAFAAAIVFSVAQLATAKPQVSDELVVYEGADAIVVRAALVEAMRLLPRTPVRLAVIDADDARPEVRPTLLRLDAFVVKESPVIYLVRQSSLLRGALTGSVSHRHALAAVIWHEMAHVGGADERQARRQEEALWMSFIRDQRVDAVAGLRYLKSLVERPDDLLMAAR
jgi:hypothetical protein